MIRLNKKALEFHDNKFYYQHRLFNGLGFQVSEQGIVEEVFEYRDGLARKYYRSEYFPNDDRLLCIDENMLVGEEDEDQEPFLYRNERFTGIAYEFDRNFCIGEMEYKDGIKHAEASMFYSGELSLLYSSHWGIFQEFEWHENGLFKAINVSSEAKNCELDIEFSERQEIEEMSISGNYFEHVPDFKDRLKIHFFEEKSFSNYSVIANRLFLASSGVDDAIFSELRSCAGFNDLEELLIFNTSVSSESFAHLANLKKLKKIVFRDNRNEIRKAAKSLKRKRPDLLVKLNHDEI